MARALRIPIYPARLSDTDLESLQNMLLGSFDYSPHFSGWLVEILQAEQLRRLERKPVNRFAVPVDWPGVVLSEALTTVTALTYNPPSYAAGQFVDALLKGVNAIAANRLEQVR